MKLFKFKKESKSYLFWLSLLVVSGLVVVGVLVYRATETYSYFSF